MVYNFKARFAPLIESGQKLTTIRAPRKDGKLPKPGETLKLFTGMRTKACRKLGERTCLSVKRVAIMKGADSGKPVLYIDLKWIHEPAHLNSVAIRDGFASWEEMGKFFEETHGPFFEGHLIEWFPHLNPEDPGI